MMDFAGITKCLNLITEKELELLQNYISEMRELISDNSDSEHEAAGNEKCNHLYSKYYDIIKLLLEALCRENAAQNVQNSSETLDTFLSNDFPGNVTEMQETASLLECSLLQNLPRLRSIIPQKHVIPNNKLANSLTKDIVDTGAVDLVVLGKGNKEITTRCILNYEGDNVSLSSRRPITEYARNVADAVTSLYVYGDQSHIITPAMVYRAMVHATETETPSPQQIGAVTRALDILRFVRVQIDCSRELQKRNVSLNGEVITGGGVDTYLLALKKIWVMSGDKRILAYKIMEPPVLYDYSRLVGQVLNVPAALLDIRGEDGSRIANTERRIAVKGYLMRRISVMKGRTESRQSHHILYDTIFSEVCDNEDFSRKEKQSIREYISLVLKSWERKKFITGYEELTHGRQKTGIKIEI